MASAPTGGVVLVVIAGIIVIIAGVVVAFLGVEAVVLRWLRPAHPSIPGTRLGIWRAVMHLAGAPRVPGTVVQGPAPEGLHVPTPQTPNPDLPENLPDMPASPITAPQYVHACLQR